ncbi:MAG: tail fiber domain-containing protein, partial [Flavobacteriales bacterium]|nr:tail fiber domain-containing protein [Flavobacteriales bacterium]
RNDVELMRVDDAGEVGVFLSGNTLVARSNGNVGIGTTNPAEKLHIEGPDPDVIIRGTSTGDSGNLFFQRSRTGATSLVNGDDIASLVWFGHDGTDYLSVAATITAGVDGVPGLDDMPGYLKFLTTPDGANLATERMRITSNGNVGIGTTTPGSTLDVHEPGFSGTLNVDRYYRLGSWNFISNPSGGVVAFGGVTAAQWTVAAFYAGGSEQMRINSSGNVGIGTTTPGGQFELSLDQGRKPATNTWTIVSDERLKNIEGSYTKGLNEILQLQPITYHYKNRPLSGVEGSETEGLGERIFSEEVLNKQNVGFSAQAVQKIFPEAVGTDADGYLNFNMHAILVAYVNAIKELKAENEALKDEVAEISVLKIKVAEIDALKAELEAVKEIIGMEAKK